MTDVTPSTTDDPHAGGSGDAAAGDGDGVAAGTGDLTEPKYRPITVRTIRHDGEVRVEEIHIHPLAWCEDEGCPFDHPSEHHMRTWQKTIRLDKADLVERTCPHGIGHPDPDSVAWAESDLKGTSIIDALFSHTCDGCCRDADTLTAESEV